tara:strand:- start:93 stop:1196 length:1104 start_codon:yes stop_codon:yes gene_type:complete
MFKSQTFSDQSNPKHYRKACLTLAAYLIPCLTLSTLLSKQVNAQAAYWQVSGRIVDINNCPFPFQEIRVRSRLTSVSGVGLGGTPPYFQNFWGAYWASPASVHLTDANGFFRVTKTLPFLNPNLPRDISIEARGSFQQWVRIALFTNVSVSDRTSVNGNLWRFDLGDISTDLLRIDPATCPRREDDNKTFLFDPDHFDLRDRDETAAEQQQRNAEEDSAEIQRPVTIEEVPQGFLGNIDLEIVETLVVNRSNQDPTRGITTSYVTVRNNGTSRYNKNISAAMLTLTLPHLPEDAINSWNKVIPSLDPGEEKELVMYYGNFQTGQTQNSPWDSYEIIYEVDSTSVIFESNENNNVQNGWYTPGTETYN